MLSRFVPSHFVALALTAIATFGLCRGPVGAQELVWIKKQPYLKYTPDLTGEKLKADQYWCMNIFLGKKDTLLLDVTNVSSLDNGQTVYWDAKNRTIVYSNRAADRAKLFEGVEFTVYDPDRRFLKHNTPVLIPLQNATEGGFTWGSIGKEVKIFVLMGYFSAKPVKEVPFNPKLDDPSEKLPVNRELAKRATWMFSKITVLTPAESFTASSEPREDEPSDTGTSPKASTDDVAAAEALRKAKLMLNLKQEDKARTALQELIKKYAGSPSAKEAAKLLEKLPKK